MPKGRPDNGYAWTPQREKVLRILASAGGSLDDEAGYVVSRLKEKTGHDTTQALSMVIKQLENSGLVKRDVTGRRTYRIELVPEALSPEHQRLLGINGSQNLDRRDQGSAPPAKVPRETAEELEDDAPAVPQGGDATDYRRLADELLKSALTAIAHKTGDPKLKVKLIEAEARVAEYRERIKDLEDRLRDQGDELLRTKEALRIAEHNLSVERKKHARQLAERGSDAIADRLTPRERKELEDLKRLMETRPV